MDYGVIPPLFLSAVPGLAICTKILTANRFNLWGPGKLMVSLVTGIVPSIITVGGHEWIKRDVLLGLTKCSVCLETRAVATQMCTGIILPTMLGFAVANHNLVGNSWKKELFPGWCITKKDFFKCSNIMIGNAILQALVVSVILYQQVDEWHNVRVQLQRRMDIDESKPRPPSSKIITTIPVDRIR